MRASLRSGLFRRESRHAPTEGSNPLLTDGLPNGQSQAPRPSGGTSRLHPSDTTQSRGPSLNRVSMIGRLTADPQLRYTPNGTAVASFRIANNGTDEVQFHNLSCGAASPGSLLSISPRDVSSTSAGVYTAAAGRARTASGAGRSKLSPMTSSS